MITASAWQKQPDGRSRPLTQAAKDTLAWLTHGTGLLRLGRKAGFRFPGLAVMILAYHRIVRDIHAARQASPLPQLTSARTFELQLSWIAERYDLISLDRALDALRGAAPLDRDAVVITIDDGYRETYEVAFPILRRLGCPATVYVPTAFIGTDQPILDDALFVLIRDALNAPHCLQEAVEEAGIAPPAETEGAWRPDQAGSLTYLLMNRLPHADLERLRQGLARRLPGSSAILASLRLMTWPMVREMHRAGLTIGSHSRTHRRLPLEPPNVAWQEIAGSKTELEAQLQAPASHFAYPDGRLSPTVGAAVKRAGYRSGAGTDETPNRVGCNPYTLGRKIFWEHTSEAWPGRHSRAMTLAQASGLFHAIRTTLRLGTRVPRLSSHPSQPSSGTIGEDP